MTLARGLHLCGAGVACLCLIGGAALGKPQKKEDKQKTRMTYGNVDVESPAEISVKTNPLGLNITGKNTLVTIPYVRSKALLKIHADSIVTHTIEKDEFAETTLEGNLRFTITQASDSGGTRSLTGTARQGSLNRRTQKIVLTGDVKATLTDGENLAEPAKFTASRIEADMSVNPYRYTLIGEGGKHGFRLRPKESVAKDPKQNRLAAGEIYVHDYDRVELQSKSDMIFLGKSAVFEFKEANGDGVLKAHSPRIHATFNAANSELERFEASGGVQIRIERAPKLADGKRGAMETLEGYSTTLTQDVRKRTLTLEGGVHFTYAAPDSLAVPAEILAEKVVSDYITGSQQRLQLYGNPKTSKLTLHPKPSLPVAGANAPKPPEGAASRFQWGALSFTQFAYASWETGKEAEARGNRVVLQSKDAESQSEMRFLAQHIGAKFGEDALLKSAVAEGVVEYEIHQKPKQIKPGAERPNQALKGSATRILFANSKGGEDQSAEIQGPFRMEIIAPEKLLEPGVVEGKEGDLIRLRLAGDSYEFDIVSPKETATIRLLPLELVDMDAKDAPEKRKEKP